MSTNANHRKPSRVYYPRKNICQWKKILFEYFDNDGDKLTVPEFCKKHNIGEHSFYKWRHKLYPKSFKDKVVKVVGKVGSRDKISVINDNDKLVAGRFIAVKAVGDSSKFADESKVMESLRFAPDIVSPLKITLSGIDLEFSKGCQLSELTKLISVFNVAKAE